MANHRRPEEGGCSSCACSHVTLPPQKELYFSIRCAEDTLHTYGFWVIGRSSASLRSLPSLGTPSYNPCEMGLHRRSVPCIQHRISLSPLHPKVEPQSRPSVRPIRETSSFGFGRSYRAAFLLPEKQAATFISSIR